MQNPASRDPREHAARIRGELADTAEHLREDLERVDDLQARALFETAREVIDGLIKAFEHFQSRAPAWASGR